MTIVVSNELQNSSTDERFSKYLSELNGKRILLPDKFLPEIDFLAIHYENFLNR